jgi:hypothetical protein
VNPAVEAIGGPAAWVGEDMDSRTDWKIDLNDEHVAELLSALAHTDVGRPLREIGREDFPLRTLGPLLEGLIDELVDGRGFVLLRGIPVESLTEGEAEIVCWGIGRHLGHPLPQGMSGDLLMHVRDEGVDLNDPRTRGYQHTGHLNYHSDTSDVVGLLCLRPAKEGGVSTIISSVAVHDEIARRRPDLAELMSEPWWHDRKRGDGPDSFFQCPLYAVNDDGKLFTYYGADYILSAVRGPGVPPLTDAHLEAMKLIDSLNNDPRFVLNMNFQPGDLQLLNNYLIMHARTAFVDYSEPERKRDLIRIWLVLDRDLGLPKALENRGLMPRSAALRS